MNALLFEKGFIIKSNNFFKIEKIRRDLKDAILKEKENLSYKKCAILLNDLYYFSKLGMSVYDYVKQKYGVDVELLKNKKNMTLDELENYAFYVFAELNKKIEKEKNEINIDLLDDYDLTCYIHFYPTSESVLLLVDTCQQEYLDIISEHLEINRFGFDVSLDTPPYGVSNIDWSNRAKEWLLVLSRCGGVDNWLPSSGGFSVEMTENGLFIPDTKEIYKYMDLFKNVDFEKALESLGAENAKFEW